jgi:3'-5' exoribonuclease 1
MEQLAGGGVEALREALGELKLDTRGHKAVLKKRLRSAHRKTPQASIASTATASLAIARRTETAGPSRPSSQDFDSYCVVDFEATCQKYEPKHGSRFDFPNEVRRSITPGLPVILYLVAKNAPLTQIIEFPVLLLQWRHKSDNSSSSDDSGCAYAAADEYRDTNCEDADDDQDWDLVIIDEFRRFVRPSWRPKLTEYCQELTGISQVGQGSSHSF